MLIEQIIEFKLRSPGTHGLYMYSYNWLFLWRSKNLCKANLPLDYYLQLKYCMRQNISLSPSWAKSHTKFNTKNQDFKILI